MSRSLRIAMIGLRGIPSTYGGIERHVEAVAPRLAARGHEVTVYGRSHSCASGVYRGVRQIALPTLATKHLDTTVYALLASLHACAPRADVIHYHGIGPSLFSALPRLAGRAIVVTSHGLDWRREKWGRGARAALKLGERAGLRCSHVAVSLSQEMRAHYRRQYGAETVVIGNGVDLPDDPGSDQLGPRFGLDPGRYLLFVGRLVPEKALHHLVRVFRGLDLPLSLAIAGGASHSSKYARDLRALAGGDERIRFLDFVAGRELQQLYANAFAFVLCSSVEGQSMALLEAMSHRLPVVVSDLPENLEVVTARDRAGALVFPRDRPDALGSRIMELWSSPELAARLRRAARHIVEENFAWDSIVAKLEDVYRIAFASSRS